VLCFPDAELIQALHIFKSLLSSFGAFTPSPAGNLLLRRRPKCSVYLNPYSNQVSVLPFYHFGIFPSIYHHLLRYWCTTRHRSFRFWLLSTMVPAHCHRPTLMISNPSSGPVDDETEHCGREAVLPLCPSWYLLFKQLKLYTTSTQQCRSDSTRLHLIPSILAYIPSVHDQL
jgi:hypothetical protein